MPTHDHPPRFHLPCTLSSLLFGLFLLLVPFEDWGTGLRDAALWLTPLALAWENRREAGDWLARRGWRWAGLYGRAVAGWVGIAACSAAAAAVSDSVMEPEAGGVFLAALKRLIPFVLVGPILLVLIGQRQFEEHAALGDPDLLRRSRRLQRWLWGCLGAFFGWLVVASIFSADPEVSYRYLFKEMGAYGVAFCVLRIKVSGGRGGLRPFWIQWPALVSGVLALAGVGIFLTAYFGLPETRGFLVDQDLIRFNYTAAGNPIIRLQFPFSTHNRLGSFMLTSLMLAVAAVAVGRSLKVRWLMMGAILCMLAALVLSGTRGAMLAAALGLVVWGISRPRWLAAFAVLGLIVVAILPAENRRLIQSIADPQTYQSRINSVHYRLVAWRYAGEMIVDRPLTGLGYGWPLFEDFYPLYNEQDIERKPHAHNNYLELGAETGVPGAVLFGMYQVLLLLGGLALVRHRTAAVRRAGWAILALVLALNLFGMTNYSLRRNVGFMVWIAYGAAQGIVVSLSGRKEITEQTQ